jgi:DNA-binding NtrC family response regulator
LALLLYKYSAKVILSFHEQKKSPANKAGFPLGGTTKNTVIREKDIPMLRALVVDDDQAFTGAVAEFIEQQGFSVVTADSLQQARSLFQAAAPDLLLIDLMLPDGSGLDLIHEADIHAKTRIVVITGHASLEAAIQSLRAQVADFLVKPIDVERLKACLQAVTDSSLSKETTALPKAVTAKDFERLVGESAVMRELRKMLEKVAPTDATVMLQGQSGTGKDIIAETIHKLSPRGNHRYLAVNCGAVSPQLIGTELFGHEKGSFTGATRQHRGHFERASGGTLFLDEVTEMPLDLQVQLLRVLETGALIRIGGDTEIPVDVRLIAATNRDPEKAIADGKLREDLYFRLMVFPIRVPPLRERTGDVLLLAEHFLAELNRQYGVVKRFTSGAIGALEHYTWPGNVRELRNAVQRAFILTDGEIEETHFPQQSRLNPDAGINQSGGLNLAVGTSIDDAERRLILATLDHHHGDKPQTAEALGISLKTLYNRLKQYGAD